MQKVAQSVTSSIGLLFETSWEVCNKIGGIYTVLSTKARVLHEQFSDRLIFIGPDVWSGDSPSPVFREDPSLLGGASSKLDVEGVGIRTGRWDIPGNPIVILVTFSGIYSSINDIFAAMWQKFGVDSLHAYGDYVESCAFAVAAAKTVKALTEFLKVNDSEVVAHYDEWTTGMGLLWTKLYQPEAATVFTTHATSIGRSICGNGKPLYEYFTAYNGDQMAAELNMQSKHSLEKAAAHNADCFTAVSAITARECEQLLEIKPQVVTPNGFEPDFVPVGPKFKELRNKGRKRLLDIASLLKGREFDDNVMIVATSGRNEYRNKGLDIFLDALAISDSHDDGRHILALVLVPAWVSAPSGALTVDLEDRGSVRPDPDFLTHRLNNEDSDAVCCRIRQLEGEGKLGHKVDVMFVPCYLDGYDDVVNISYYDLLPAIDLTVFPSYYEPWGYTPLESVAFGVPTVTSDKSGFGQWVSGNFVVGIETCGVDVVPRTDTNYNRAAESIAEDMDIYAGVDASHRAKAAKAALHTAGRANWKFFIKKYDEAFDVAFKRRDSRLTD